MIVLKAIKWTKEMKTTLSLTLTVCLSLGGLLSCSQGKSISPRELIGASESIFDEETQIAFSDLEYALYQKITTQLYFEDKILESEENSVTKEYALSYYRSLSLPVEVIIGSLSHLGSSNLNPVEVHVHRIRIGYAYRDGFNYREFIKQEYRESNPSKIPDEQSVERQFWSKVESVASFFPYNITASLTIDKAKDLFSQPYYSHAECLSKDGTGFIDFSFDGRSPVYPIKIWFFKGKVSGVDVTCSGLREDHACSIPKTYVCVYKSLEDSFFVRKPKRMNPVSGGAPSGD